MIRRFLPAALTVALATAGASSHAILVSSGSNNPYLPVGRSSSPVPEPGVLALTGLTLGILALGSHRRRNAGT